MIKTKRKQEFHKPKNEIITKNFAENYLKSFCHRINKNYIMLVIENLIKDFLRIYELSNFPCSVNNSKNIKINHV